MGQMLPGPPGRGPTGKETLGWVLRKEWAGNSQVKARRRILGPCPGEQKPQNLLGASWVLDVSRATQEQGKAREMGRVEAKEVGPDPEWPPAKSPMGQNGQWTHGVKETR